MDTKRVEIEKRTFIINKINARDSLKILKLAAEKAMPMFSNLFVEVDKKNVKKNLDEKQTFDALQKFLATLDDSDLDKLIEYTLTNCYEQLKAGTARVLNLDGTYGVMDLEYDLILTLRLAAEVLIFNFKDFFDVSRWNSIFKPVISTFPQSA